MSESLTSRGGENVPGNPGAYATHNVTYLVRGPLERASGTPGYDIIWGVYFSGAVGSLLAKDSIDLNKRLNQQETSTNQNIAGETSKGRNLDKHTAFF